MAYDSKNIYIQFGQGICLLGSSSPCPAKYQLASLSDSMRATFYNYAGQNKCSIPDNFKKIPKRWV